MIVDDEPKACKNLQGFLEKKGCQVQTASDGNEAMEKARKFHPQVILLDILMPGPQSLDVLRWVKQWKPEVEVIMTTAVISHETQEKFSRAGAYACLQKPLYFELVWETVQQALKHQKSFLSR